MRRVRVRVSGKVQGVFFRATCAERARALHLTGWVRNARDGGVDAVFEGDRESVEVMLDWCRAGPPLARVEDVAVTDEAPRGGSGFRVTS
ncbi:MAG: acylphosphatase [Actinomycetota bacterium]